jgi:hypothetical protein
VGPVSKVKPMRTDSGVGLMPSLFKSLFRKFHELPSNLPDRHYRFFVFSNYAFLLAGLFHLAFIFIFALHDLYILAIYNIFSTLLWVLCIYLNFRGWWRVAITAGNIEIVSMRPCVWLKLDSCLYYP